MDFPTAVRTCFQKYIVFSDRAQRSEFWYFVLFNIFGSVVLGLIDSVVFGWAYRDPSVFGSIFGLIMFLPSISVAVRRLHDTDRSGWWWWLWLIPLIGWIILIVWYATKGTDGPNRFGPDPMSGSSGRGEAAFSHHTSIPSVPRKD